MKKLLFAALLFPLLASAQDKSSDDYRWELGINGGVNFTNVSGLNTTNELDSRFGRLYGMTLIYHATKAISIKTDLDYENKGWILKDYSITNGTNTTTQNINQNLDYFDVPLFLHVGIGKRFKVDLNFGTYVAFLIKDRAFYIDNNGMEVPVTNALFTGYNNFDFGLTYGGGIDYVLGKRVSFGFDLLYEQGLIAIKDGTLKNSSLDFDIGLNYMFGAKK